MGVMCVTTCVLKMSLMTRLPAYAISLLALVTCVASANSASVKAAGEEDWIIRSFAASYTLERTGRLSVTEEITVDFGNLERHGIFRDIPVEYSYDSESNRLIDITAVAVTEGGSPVRFQTDSSGPLLRIKIGDPDKLVTGEQHYVIDYTVSGALNPFPDHDEMYWNVTGNEWPVRIEQASATVVSPEPAIERIACLQGPTGSTVGCASSGDERSALFETTAALTPGSGLTLVVGLRKGIVAVGPPELVPVDEDPLLEADELFEANAATLALTLLSAALVVAALVYRWWVAGRDRWFGDMYYVHDNPPEETKPLFSRETIVVEYQPPEVQRGRRLRPAEIGLLLDERADTLDVSATIVDLAVRRHIVIRELPKGGIFGLFRSQDYELARDAEAGESDRRDELLGYEHRLVDALFDGGSSVKLSELKDKFHEDLARVKSDLYDESVKILKLFPWNPETVRLVYRAAGAGVALGGALITFVLGTAFGAGLAGIPVVLGGIALLALAYLMPRRTAQGRLLYRRCLGFRLYMTKAEKERQAFAERANLFEEYLPYAIVYGCVTKWAKAFEGLGLEGRQVGWYVGARGFVPVQFAESLRDFSSSVSGVMASTPGSSGGSGFGGGGSSGGGVGGGGGGSW